VVCLTASCSRGTGPAAPSPTASTPGSASAREEAWICAVLSEEASIPPGVAYERAGAQPNRNALVRLSRALLLRDGSVPSDDLLSPVLLCGPGVWRRVKGDPAAEQIGGEEVSFAIPADSTPREGRQLLSERDAQLLLDAFVRAYRFGPDAKIRRPSAAELKLYSEVHVSPIREPIFVVAGNNAIVLVAFSSGRVSWIDDLAESADTNRNCEPGTRTEIETIGERDGCPRRQGGDRGTRTEGRKR
jgi:hypothetical protein